VHEPLPVPRVARKASFAATSIRATVRCAPQGGEMPRALSRAAFAVSLVVVVARPVSVLAQTQAERCLAMRLALAGVALSNSLACQAWSVATRTAPSASCLAHGEDQLAQQLRAADCATDAEIADLIEATRGAATTVVDSQVEASRLSQFENTLWDTEVIADLGRPYQEGMSWPDESCRAQGSCPTLILLDCRTTQHADGSLDTVCNSESQSASEVHDAPVITTENVALPTGEILSRGSSGASYQVVITLSADGSSYTGAGFIGSLPLFLRGHRIGDVSS
jgi:hypothetical protein